MTDQPVRPTCSISGGQYEPESPSAFVHEYLEARDAAAREKALKRMFSKPIFLGGTTDEFEAHSLADLAADATDATREIIEQRYLSLGTTFIANSYAVEGLTIIRALYALMRRWETSSGDRWHKGSGLFFLSQAYQATGATLEAELAMWLAFLEDLWREHEGGTAARTLPAYSHLVGQMGLARERVDKFADALELTVQNQETWSPTEPEQSYLLTIGQRRFWMRKRAPLMFIPEVATHFWKSSRDLANSTHEK